MFLFGLALAAFILALIPALVLARNLGEFRPLPNGLEVGGERDAATSAACSVLIPARDEESSIAGAVESVLLNTAVDLEVIVLDDGSTDQTASIVEALRLRDPRVRLVAAPPLPQGWCGKQHACQVLASLARHDVLIWIDADVRLSPDALGRFCGAMQRDDVALLSGFPFEETGTLLEKLLIPLIHFVLLGFCPVWMMRRQLSPALGAGCGQLFITRRHDYEKAGGHAAIRASLHDGVTLPRAYRRAGLATDIFDATDIARCRMYRSAGEVWNGLLKNAHEGLAAPRSILPWTLILGLGQVTPLPLVFIALISVWTRPAEIEGIALLLALAAWALGFHARWRIARRFRQSCLSAMLHPFGVAMLLGVQWQSLITRELGMRTTWRGRSYSN